MENKNPMRKIKIEKVTVNIGIGSSGDRLDNAKELLKRVTNEKPIETKAKDRNPVFKLRKGLPIGAKVTLRGKKAKEFLEKALVARKKTLKESNFDRTGNVSFGVPEYIDFPGIKYDPVIGMMGFDVCVSVTRSGKRVRLKRIKQGKIGKTHLVSKEDCKSFISEEFGIKIIESE
ncbi:MAG: 50S ribosomal protein L5 [Candidatus ainarchaeum sp.]|nr:50S ribosomal protein L5 [Candidatus ainarchaeum sp.]